MTTPAGKESLMSNDDSIFLTTGPDGQPEGVTDRKRMDADVARYVEQLLDAKGDVAVLARIAGDWRNNHPAEYTAMAALHASTLLAVTVEKMRAAIVSVDSKFDLGSRLRTAMNSRNRGGGR
ncbi:hypothetical protein ACTD5D_33220 [Nocardia takedensis]|uniref:hypothetical protein n=1 Tax=Nocardia takedensis TaxID=259390 RepID=UPI003F7666A7